jgi:hypothetical protein
MYARRRTIRLIAAVIVFVVVVYMFGAMFYLRN